MYHDERRMLSTEYPFGASSDPPPRHGPQLFFKQSHIMLVPECCFSLLANEIQIGFFFFNLDDILVGKVTISASLIIIIINRHLSTLYGSRMPPSAPQVKICSQAKGGTKVTSMMCVTDNKPRLIPYSLRKGLQL